eukprot:3116463-Heterocapsa_arctica.AAC.1
MRSRRSATRPLPTLNHGANNRGYIESGEYKPKLRSTTNIYHITTKAQHVAHFRREHASVDNMVSRYRK